MGESDTKISTRLNQCKFSDSCLKEKTFDGCERLRLSSFLCALCQGVLADPVTLKCGHTFSKKCILTAAKSAPFMCLKCPHRYSYAYLSTLKTNVKVMALVECFWRVITLKAMEIYDDTTCLLYYWSSECDTFSSIPLKEINEINCNYYNKENALLPTQYNLFKAIDNIAGQSFISDLLDISQLDKVDFECPLCMQILWEPVSTTCGHTFCKLCLYRCFDHQPYCPLCKSSLKSFLSEQIQSTTGFLEVAIKTLLPKEFIERKYMHREELEDLHILNKDTESVVPVFICTIAYPTVPCPLHVFEPRYKLMIRRCMESGSRRFGMCTYLNDEVANYGTILEIQDVKYFPDGRSVVDTVGHKRFKVSELGICDGYHIAKIKYLKDSPPTDYEIEDTKEMHDLVHKASRSWFVKLTRSLKCEILQHFGSMPEVEENYLTLSDGPSWFWWMLAVLPVESSIQIRIISMTSLPQRLKVLYRVLVHIKHGSAYYR